jgi:hypothetical protein
MLSEIPGWLMASAWGGLVSLGLLFGALAGLYAPLKHRGITSVMAAGAGILIAAASLDLIVAAVRTSGPLHAGISLVFGAAAFSLANLWFARRAAKHRKRCGECVQQPTENGTPGSGLAIAVGTLMDALPEAAVLGLETTRIGARGDAARGTDGRPFRCRAARRGGRLQRVCRRRAHRDGGRDDDPRSHARFVPFNGLIAVFGFLVVLILLGA